ncbi:hypothetical protein OEZ85_008681 [Tetradesmus obliquus]|uniref:Uncharacterized protein n=1 Tax=Tetradesmus obliquus TaxID=3088 RepID=A0ABY8TP74_TETOB|nr:hypothetical protein OEZ85_008681 [Tetradesmus obliquus]
MDVDSITDTIARRACRHASVSWCGLFCSSNHVSCRLRKALQQHLLHITSRSQKSSKGRYRLSSGNNKRARAQGKQGSWQQADSDAATLQASLQQQLLHAAAHGDVSKLRQLVQQQGVDVNQPCGPQGRTALHAAAEHGQCSCCSVLLELGADSYVYDERQVSALMLAAMHGHERVVQCVQLLLAAGARVNRADKEGRTALWVASRGGHMEVVRLLLRQPRIKHIQHFISGTSPLQAAQAAGHAGVAYLLAAHLATCRHQQQQQLQQQSQEQQQQQVQEHSSSGQMLHDQQQQQQQQQQQRQKQRGQPPRQQQHHHQLSKQEPGQPIRRPGASVNTGKPSHSHAAAATMSAVAHVALVH